MARRRDDWRGGGDNYGFGRYVTVAEKRANATAEIAKRRKKGASLSPVVIEGRAIAKTFWGKAWCRHLEDHCDYDNRLPRGRTYARNGSVIDLQIRRGEVSGLVCGKSTYKVRVDLAALDSKRWQRLCKDSAGRIDSLVALLRGELDAAVLKRLCDPSDGMFPQNQQLEVSCSCPDWARMCKHVAAVLYGVGARLDGEPELLFVLRGVDQIDLMGQAIVAPMATAPGADTLAGDDLGALFGVEMDGGFEAPLEVAKPNASKAARIESKATRKRRTTPTAANFALETLARFEGEEMVVEGLWQLAHDVHSRPALRQALKRLHSNGLVARDQDDSRRVWWHITDAGLAAVI